LNPSADAIDALLPQTQCRQCGYGGCRPYAEAVASGRAPINRCPPGGTEVIAELAALLDTPPLPPDESTGKTLPPSTAFIEEALCIGCTLCIAACPVDAIVGARRLMHTVIADGCTGCALCLPPCPVDCIALQPSGEVRDRGRQLRDAVRLRENYQARLRRLSGSPSRQHQESPESALPKRQKREALDRALARARSRLAGRP